MNELRWLTIELILDQVENKQNLRYHLGQFFILYTFCLSKQQDAVVLDEIWSNSEAQNGFKYFLRINILMHLRFHGISTLTCLISVQQILLFFENIIAYMFINF